MQAIKQFNKLSLLSALHHFLGSFCIMEIWKDIIEFEREYQISNLGRVKSLKSGKEKILKNVIDSKGYYKINLYKSKKTITFRIHQLVAIAFLNHIPNKHSLVVNHKDFDTLNNNVDNLEIITQRENTSKKNKIYSSKYTGVSWNKKREKWESSIRIKSKSKHLGCFINEYEAHLAYEIALKNIKLQNI